MHIAYPFGDELVALAKHFPNVYVDLCWAWSLDPLAARRFLRQALHAAPLNKLFAFGGDARLPATALACSLQARHHLHAALQEDVDADLLTEPQAIHAAPPASCSPTPCTASISPLSSAASVKPPTHHRRRKQVAKRPPRRDAEQLQSVLPDDPVR